MNVKILVVVVVTGSITPFGAEQKANVIVTRVKIMIKFVLCKMLSTFII